MKQYKFKCPICGKWHDIFRSLACVAECDSEQTAYAHFQAKKLETLLKLLRKLNIEVAEVCGNLKWKYNKAGWFESQEVIRNGKLGRYYVRLNTIMSDNQEIRLKDFEATFAPLKWEDGNAIVFDYFDTEKSAKAACQADFQKRRAR